MTQPTQWLADTSNLGNLGPDPRGKHHGYIESFFGKLRDELLSFEVFYKGQELQSALTDFQEHYNNHRPHLGLGGLTPAAFKERLTTNKLKEEILQL